VLTRSPGESGLFMDFDGTLAEIVPLPEDARPLAGVPEVLSELNRLFRTVAVVSGRSAVDLAGWLGPEVEIWGLHGAQRAYGGRVEIAPVFAHFEEPVQAALQEASGRFAEADIPGAVVENKHIMVGLHWRNAKDREKAEGAIAEIARELAAKYGLQLGQGKMSLELKPPIDVSKGDVVVNRVRDEVLRAVGFAGDDLVDLPAFNVLDELAKSGTETVKVAVASEEAPPELIERADLVVNGPGGMLGWLQRLRDVSGGVRGSSPD
jgi:trehalose 6-phosphate phosphatase